MQELAAALRLEALYQRHFARHRMDRWTFLNDPFVDYVQRAEDIDHIMRVSKLNMTGRVRPYTGPLKPVKIITGNNR